MKLLASFFALLALASAAALVTPEIAGVEDYNNLKLYRREDIGACIACGLSFCIPSPACVSRFALQNPLSVIC
jgi:hypothetical protein